MTTQQNPVEASTYAHHLRRAAIRPACRARCISFGPDPAARVAKERLTPILPANFWLDARITGKPRRGRIDCGIQTWGRVRVRGVAEPATQIWNMTDGRCL